MDKARVGQTVLYKGASFNGTDINPAMVTRVWGKAVNLTVLPDCHEPFVASSIMYVADEAAARAYSGPACFPVVEGA